MLVEFSESVEAAVAPDVAWAYVTDWPRQGEWMPATHVRRIDGGPGAGERLVARTGFGPLGFDDTMVVTDWQPPVSCRVTHTGRVVRGDGDIIVEPSGTGSRITWREEVVIPGGRLAPGLWTVSGPVVRRLFRVALRRLRTRLEALG